MSKISKNIFTEKILHRIKKVKKTDPTKTTQKTDLYNKAKSFWPFLRELWPFLKFSDYGKKYWWRTLMVPDRRLGGKGHPWHNISSWETQRKILCMFGSEIFSLDWNIRVGKCPHFEFFLIPKIWPDDLPLIWCHQSKLSFHFKRE